MVQELPNNRPQNQDAVENAALNFAPEPTTRTDALLWPTSRREGDARRNVLEHYPTLDTATGHLPEFRGIFGDPDKRFENLSRGSRQFTAHSLALNGGPAVVFEDTENGGRRQHQIYGDAGPGAQSRNGTNLTTLADLLTDMRTPGGGQYNRPDQPRTDQPLHAALGDLRNLFADVSGRNTTTRTDRTAPARPRENPGNSDEIDIFAQIRARDTRQGGPTETRTEGRTEGRPDTRASEVRPPAETKPFKLEYPGGKKTLDVTKFDKDGNLAEFTLKHEGGEATYYKNDAGQWIKKDRYDETTVNGSFELRNGKELVFKKPNGDVQIHKLDGTIARGRELKDGSTIDFDSTGKNAVALHRKDGSKIEATYDKDNLTKVVETDKTGNNRVTWTKDEKGIWHSKGETKDSSGAWKDDGKPSREGKNLELNINGRFSYEDHLGYKHVINGDSSEKIEPKVTVNSDGTKTVEIQYPNGQGFRTLTLDKDNKLIKFSEKDDQGTRTYFKDRQGDWYLRAGLRNVKVGGDFQLDKNGDFISRDGERYDIQRLDGSIIHGKANANGTTLRFNDDNTISKLTRKDGSVVDVMYDKGEKKVIVDTNKDETARTVWVKNDKGTWTSVNQKKDGDKWVTDASKKSEERKDVEINGQGLTIATDLRGFKHVIGADGQKLNEGPNGSKFTFDDKGRIESITYGPGANRQLKFSYDANDNLNKVEVRDGRGNLQQTRTKTGEGQWQITKADGTSGGVWKGDMKLSPEGNFMQRDAKDIAAGQWQVITPGYDKYNERVSADGKRFTRIYADKSQIESEKLANGEERVTKITRGKESREFRYDGSGKLTEVVDTTTKGTNSWKPDGDKVKVYPNGDVAWEKNDGTAIVKKRDFSTVELDKDGDVRKVTTKEGKTRTFEYDMVKDKKELVRITDTRPTKDGEKSEVWTRRRNADGSVTDQFVSPGADGKEKVRNGVEVLQFGDYKYKGSDGKDRISKVGKSDDANGFSENVDEARERLMEAMEGNLDEPRRQRLQQMMARFEQRGRERVEAQTAGGMSAEQAQSEWEQKIAKTYDHLAHMVSSNESGATYDKATRAKLVENCVFSMAWPVKANDQGNWGCCWQISGVYLGVIQHPDKMAKMLDELATKGTFTDVTGKTWNPPKHLLAFTDQGGNWTIGNCGNGRRSPCSEIWTSVAAMMSNGGSRMDRGASGGTMEGCMRAMKAITGDTWRGTNQGSMTQKQYQQDLLLKGGVILFSPGHMYLGTMEKNNGQWQIVSSLQHGDGGRHVNGTLTNLRSWDVRGGGRGRYTPDIPQFPGCNDGPVGPGPRPGPRRRDDWRHWNRWNNWDDGGDGAPFNPNSRWNDPGNWRNVDRSNPFSSDADMRYRLSEAEKKAKAEEDERSSRRRRKKDVSEETESTIDSTRNSSRRRRF